MSDKHNKGTRKPETDKTAKDTAETPEIEINDVDAISDEEEGQVAEEVEQEEMNEIQKLAKELGEEKAKLEKEKKEYLFLMAEFDNFRKRTIKEKADIIMNASEKVLKGLLPIVDDFERGLDAAEKTDDAAAVKEGMKIIYNKLMKFLADNGVKPIESTGKDFDPEYHEAIAMVPGDESQKGKVIDTPTKGYTLNDKVLRYAKVAVGQ